jgi:hypothetical protein
LGGASRLFLIFAGTNRFFAQPQILLFQPLEGILYYAGVSALILFNEAQILVL